MCSGRWPWHELRSRKIWLRCVGVQFWGILYIGFASLSTFVHHCASLCIVVHLCALLCIIVHMHVCVVVKVPRTVSLTMFLCHISYI